LCGSGRFISSLPHSAVGGKLCVRAGVHVRIGARIGRQSCGACACDLSSAWRSVACDRPAAAAFLRCFLAQPPSMFVVVVHGVYV